MFDVVEVLQQVYFNMVFNWQKVCSLCIAYLYVMQIKN